MQIGVADRQTSRRAQLSSPLPSALSSNAAEVVAHFLLHTIGARCIVPCRGQMSYSVAVRAIL